MTLAHPYPYPAQPQTVFQLKTTKHFYCYPINRQKSCQTWKVQVETNSTRKLFFLSLLLQLFVSSFGIYAPSQRCSRYVHQQVPPLCWFNPIFLITHGQSFQCDLLASYQTWQTLRWKIPSSRLPLLTVHWLEAMCAWEAMLHVRHRRRLWWNRRGRMGRDDLATS